MFASYLGCKVIVFGHHVFCFAYLTWFHFVRLIMCRVAYILLFFGVFRVILLMLVYSNVVAILCFRLSLYCFCQVVSGSETFCVWLGNLWSLQGGSWVMGRSFICGVYVVFCTIVLYNSWLICWSGGLRISGAVGIQCSTIYCRLVSIMEKWPFLLFRWGSNMLLISGVMSVGIGW